MSDKIKVIEPTAVVDISIGTEYYKRIQDLVMFLLKDVSDEDLKDALQQINNSNITTEWVKHYETLLIFASSYENKILDAGFFKEVDLDS